MVSSGSKKTSEADAQLAAIANNKQNQNIDTQKMNQYYDNINKKVDAYTSASIRINSADDAKKAEILNDRNDKLVDIQNKAEAIMNDSSLTAKEKAFKLGSLDSSATGTIAKSYADLGNMEACMGVTDAINNTIAGLGNMPSLSLPTVSSSAASTTPAITTPTKTVKTESSGGNVSPAPEKSPGVHGGGGKKIETSSSGAPLGFLGGLFGAFGGGFGGGGGLSTQSTGTNSYTGLSQ